MPLTCNQTALRAHECTTCRGCCLGCSVPCWLAWLSCGSCFALPLTKRRSSSRKSKRGSQRQRQRQSLPEPTTFVHIFHNLSTLAILGFVVHFCLFAFMSLNDHFSLALSLSLSLSRYLSLSLSLSYTHTRLGRLRRWLRCGQ